VTNGAGQTPPRASASSSMHRAAPASSVCSRSASRNGWRAGGCRQRHSQRNDRHVGSFSEDPTDGTRLIARLSSNSPRPPKGGRGGFLPSFNLFVDIRRMQAILARNLAVSALCDTESCASHGWVSSSGLFYQISFFKMTRKSLAFRRRIATIGPTAKECESLTIDAGLESSSRV
jgi:hypothetical protein